MRTMVFALLALPLLFPGLFAQEKPQAAPQPVYTPSLDMNSIDKSADPCVDFYQYSCGGWRKRNPIPPDETSWSVYGKLYEDNLNFLRSILEDAARNPGRDAVTEKIGDFYGACMDQSAIERRGLSAVEPDLDSIAQLKSTREITPLLTRLQFAYGRTILFGQGSTQDPDNSEQQIAAVDRGGLGLPDRDYYLKEDAKSHATRQRYLEHVEKVFALMGEAPESARQDAATVMRIETALARAQLTRVDRRDPYKLKHKMTVADLKQLAPEIRWELYYKELHYPEFQIVNVAEPEYFKQVSHELASEPLRSWKSYLRYHVLDSSSPYLSSKFADENFDFYRKYLRGATEQQARWKRCVEWTDGDLGEALGQVYVKKVFSPELKSSTLDMVRRIEEAMGQRIQQLDWMSPETKQQAILKLQGMRNKIGYPDKWRDYSSVKITANDFVGNVRNATLFESRRRINKIGQPVDHAEWGMTPPTVNAYYNPAMNDINFPAGVLQPPLYDAKMDDAPNYGNTGGTIGHELTHGF